MCRQVTEPSVLIDSITVTTIATGTFEGINIGNSSSVNNSRLYAPFSRMHLHLGGVYQNSDFIAVFVTVEPIQVVIPQEGCACVGAVVKGGAGDILLSQGCHLNATTNAFFVSTSCAVSCPGAGCIAATVIVATDATATLTAAGAPAGTYHVIITSPGGQFCSAGTLALP